MCLSSNLCCTGPGQYADAKTGLYYNGFRYYDPLTGRYLQPDPLGLSGGLNSYTYALNNPLRYIDPEGQNPLALLPWIGYLAVGWVIGETMDYLIGYLPDNECNPLLSPQRWANAASYAIGISAAQKGVKALTTAAKLRRGLGGAGKGTTGQIAQNSPTTRVELHADLKSKGFTSNGQSKGGYETWKGPDGVTVTIKPTGEVIRTQRVWKADGSGKYSERQDYSGNRLPDQSHSTGHFVE